MVVTYQLGGNSFFLASYSLLLIPQVFLGIKFQTWGFSFGMLSGLILEVIGYAARIMLHNEEADSPMIMNVVCTTIGPAFLSAAIYLCLARIIAVYGEHLSLLRPRTITIIFMLSDFFALLLQAGGGAMTTSDQDKATLDLALALLKAGLGVHLAAIGIYVILSCHFAYAVYNNGATWNPHFTSLQVSPKFKSGLIALAVATVCVLIRTSFRVAELGGGFSSKLAQNETLFFILDGTMVLIACIGLTVFHPGVDFEGRWAEANFQLRGKKENKQDVELASV